MPSRNMPRRAAKALQAYVGALRERFGPQLLDVRMFGSWVRGEALPGSDVDVLVVLHHPTPEDLSDARGLAFDIWLAHQVLLSIRAMGEEQWQALARMESLFYGNVLRDGISLLPLPKPIVASTTPQNRPGTPGRPGP